MRQPVLGLGFQVWVQRLDQHPWSHTMPLCPHFWISLPLHEKQRCSPNAFAPCRLTKDGIHFGSTDGKIRLEVARATTLGGRPCVEAFSSFYKKPLNSPLFTFWVFTTNPSFFPLPIHFLHTIPHLLPALPKLWEALGATDFGVWCSKRPPSSPLWGKILSFAS